jgi:hypothetical protein
MLRKHAASTENDKVMELTTTTPAIFVVVAAMRLFGVVAVQIMSVPEDAETRGYRN